MQNKTMYAGIIALAMILAIMPLALAENTTDSSDAIALYNDTSNLPDGIVISPAPTNEIIEEADADLNENVSSWKINRERMKNWFTFNQEKKAERELKIAKMLLIQAKIAARNNNTEAMEKALEAHNRIINRVKERVQKINGASDEKGLKKNAEKLVGLERAIQVHEARITRLQTMLTNENLTEQQRQVIEAKIARAQNNTANLVQVQQRQQERIKTKLMAVKNLTEDEANERVEQIRDRVKTQANKLNNRAKN
ncbi:hypothetical protein FJZ17_00770 [Candidatus Pacearchaeota archaeon]|nr:hypothetical protein [Candidatus Pacearchaeota archaeon]